MPSLAEQLALYLQPLNGLRENPYRTLTGRSGNILATGSPTGGYRANDDSPAGMVGDSGAAAEYDRAISAESAASRSADLTNWLDKQAANRVPAQLEQDDPLRAAQTRAIQVSSLRPESTARPEYDALMKVLGTETPVATRARGRQAQERTAEATGLQTALEQGRRREFMSPEAGQARERQTSEARRNAQRAAQDAQDQAMSPEAQFLAGQQAGFEADVRRAGVPRDWMAESGDREAAKPTATEEEILDVATQNGRDPKLVRQYLISKGYRIIPMQK